MDENNGYRKNLIDKFSRLYVGTQGGIFTKITRKRILTDTSISEKGKEKNQFWYRHRENVKTALIDLQLFIDLAGKKNIDQVVTKESLEPIVTGLLWGETLTKPETDQNEAEIANMFIKWGFNHLREKTGRSITLSHDRTIKEALDLSDFMLATIKGTYYSTPTDPFKTF